MKWQIIILILSLLLPSIYLTLNSLGLTDGNGRLYFFRNGSKSVSKYGFVCNSTVIQVTPEAAWRICNVGSATYIIGEIFDVIPKHDKVFNDPSIVIAKAIDGDQAYYVIVNGTKWRFRDYNSTLNYSLNEERYIYANYTYLDSFPTTHYLY